MTHHGQTTYFFEFLERNFTEAPKTLTLQSLPNNLDGYVPHNQKLRTYPYIYLGFNPSNGSQQIYRYEDFLNNQPSFTMISEINPNPEVNFLPNNYRGQNGINTQDRATLSGYPTISYKTDVYNTWLAQNSQIISLNMQQEAYNYDVGLINTASQGMGDIMSQALTLNPSALTTGANLGLNLAQQSKNHDFYVKKQMAQIEKQKMLPDNASLSASNSTLLGYNYLSKNIFTRYTIKSQFAKRIDKYFDMYGYLTNELKVPNTNNRPNWNYIQTIGANILGDIPEEDLIKIKSYFDNGITLWHNPNTFLDYSQNNR